MRRDADHIFSTHEWIVRHKGSCSPLVSLRGQAGPGRIALGSELALPERRAPRLAVGQAFPAYSQGGASDINSGIAECKQQLLLQLLLLLCQVMCPADSEGQDNDSN